MKLAARLAARRGLAIAPLAGLLFVGCKSLFNPPDVDTHTTMRIAILRVIQEDYDVSPTKRPPKDTTDRAFPPGHSVPDDQAPTMTISTLRLKSGHTASSQKPLAIIDSDGSFGPMKIRKGLNLVWLDASGQAWITPPSGADHRLERTPGYQFPARPEHEPSLLRVAVNSIAFVLCLDDCGSGHCGMY
jgi:hypothetical protein